MSSHTEQNQGGGLANTCAEKNRQGWKEMSTLIALCMPLATASTGGACVTSVWQWVLFYVTPAGYAGRRVHLEKYQSSPLMICLQHDDLERPCYIIGGITAPTGHSAATLRFICSIPSRNSRHKWHYAGLNYHLNKKARHQQRCNKCNAYISKPSTALTTILEFVNT